MNIAEDQILIGDEAADPVAAGEFCACCGERCDYIHEEGSIYIVWCDNCCDIVGIREPHELEA